MEDKTRQLFLSYILENKVADVLKINNNCLCLLGMELPIKVDKTGSIVSIRNSNLDQPVSIRLTYEIWSLDHLNGYLMLAKEDKQGAILELRKTTIELLVQMLVQLKDKITNNDILSLIEDMANGRTCIKKELSKLVY